MKSFFPQEDTFFIIDKRGVETKGSIQTKMFIWKKRQFLLKDR
jgi:hypothetical protein